MSNEVGEYFSKESEQYEQIRWRGNFVSQYDFKVTNNALTSMMPQADLFLDMGCGPGTWLKEFHRRHKTCVGVDISLEMLKLCRKKQLPNVSVVLADCHHLPFKDGVFHMVMSSRVFIYLNLDVALQEVRRTLKTEGGSVLVIQVERRSIYFKLWKGLRKSRKFLETARYLSAYETIAMISKYLHVTQTKGVIFHEHISPRALSQPAIAFLLNHVYLRLVFAIEKLAAASFVQYFYASSIAVAAKKAEPRKI